MQIYFKHGFYFEDGLFYGKTEKGDCLGVI